jgi:hypothetical protein
MKRSSLAPLALLVGCGAPAPEVAPDLSARAVRVIEAEKPVRGAVRFRRLWLAEAGAETGLVCGRIDAPAELRAHESGLRFIYEDRTRHGQVEYHELWAGDAIGMGLVEQNRRVFDQLWEGSCASGDAASPWTEKIIG